MLKTSSVLTLKIEGSVESGVISKYFLTVGRRPGPVRISAVWTAGRGVPENVGQTPSAGTILKTLLNKSPNKLLPA